MDEALRLAKRVAAQQACSRQQAELLIVGGWVRVDGAVVEEPQARVRPEQSVEIDPKARPEPIAPVTLIWHKPAGLAVPEDPELPDAWVAQWLPVAQRHEGDASRLRPLGVHRRHLAVLAPLGELSSGLMAFTQNPGVARRLADTQQPLEHEWLIDVEGDVPDRAAVIAALARPVYLQREQQAPARASWQSERRLRLVIKGPRPGQLGALLERVPVPVVAARRQRIGRVGLGDLPPGRWRYASAAERF
jgi:23S rRNA pseudouridine2604 synthase